MKNTTKLTTEPEKKAFLTWTDERGRALALYEHDKALTSLRSQDLTVHRTSASNIYQNISPGNVSVRDGYDRHDYQQFRQSETLPTTPKGKMIACNHVYKSVGLIRNVIDLMADFATQGITISHPNERIQNFYEEWFRKVCGKHVSERFVNYLYRLGCNVVKRQNAKITAGTEDQMRKSSADPDIKPEEIVKPQKREIPWKYKFHNPINLGIAEEELALFADNDNFVFTVDVAPKLCAIIKKPTTDVQKKIVENMPQDIVKSIREGNKKLHLDPKKTRAFYYKRDDWECWADPLTFAILPDIKMLEKMKLADLGALDGAISSIRIWKLGSLEHKIMPTGDVMQLLAQMLMNNVGGGVMDLVWGPAIELEETSTEAYKFLGETKYGPVLTAIYAGLGIPPTLTGASQSGGLTNNYISLKTLTERLQYARDRLTEFWEEEVRIVQRAMGFRLPATILYDRMTLTDEAAEKQLLINLADRDLISIETLQERFGESPEIEQVRLRKEYRRRERNLLPPKAGPFHTAQQGHELNKIFAQSGSITPSEAGVELKEKKKGELSPAELKAKLAPKKDPSTKLKGQPGQGRPKMSKDSQKRKQKTVKPRTSAEFMTNMAKAESSLASISHVATPIYLKAIAKKNLRELTNEETDNFEKFKFYVLCNTELGADVTTDSIKVLASQKLAIPTPIDLLLKKTISMYIDENGREPTLEVLRRFQTGAVALWNINNEASDTDNAV